MKPNSSTGARLRYNRRVWPVRIKERWLPLGLSALALLLAAAALLQYRWINRAAEADLLEHRQSLNGALAGVRSEFNAAIQELIPMFRPAPDVPAGVNLEAHLLRLASQWQSAANRPALLGAVYLGETVNGRSTLSRLDARDMKFGPQRDRKFMPQAWPDALAFYREVLDRRLRMPEGGIPYFPRGVAFELLGTRPLLIFPLVEVRGRPDDFRQGPPPPPPRAERPRPPPVGEPPRPPRQLREVMVPAGDDQPPDAPQLLGWCFLELDVEYLRSQLLPGMIERLFGAAGLSNYQLAVVGGDAPELIYQSDAALTINALAQVDAGIVILGQETVPPMAPPPERLRASRPRPPRPPRDGANPRRDDPQARPEENPPPLPEREADAPRRAGDEFRADQSPGDSWRLVAHHRAGSLEAQVNQTRRRNLMLNFALFVLLAGSIVLLALSARRARRLARQQMEFVVNITHELRTPLSVIHSASYNLASGVVGEPRRVQDYGAMIQNEARRLSSQVEQALSFAGVESKRRPYDFQPQRVTDIVERAMSDCAPAFAEAGWQVEYEKDEPALFVMADAQAIESAITNLLQNALKYAGAGKRLRVAVRARRNGKRDEAQITVADRGPGVDAKDLPHLFEPFYRSAGVRASSTPGAGLGLSIVQKHVQAHRGRVTVTSQGGTAFTIHLPAMDEPAQ